MPLSCRKRAVAPAARKGETGTKAARARGVCAALGLEDDDMEDDDGEDNDESGDADKAPVDNDGKADAGTFIEAEEETRMDDGDVTSICLCRCCCSFSRRTDSAANTAAIDEMAWSLLLMPLVLPLVLPLPLAPLPIAPLPLPLTSELKLPLPLISLPSPPPPADAWPC